MATPTYIPLATTTLASSASSVTFGSIPQDYRDLVLVFNGGGSSAGLYSAEILPNGSAADGSAVEMRGTGSSAQSFDLGNILMLLGSANSNAIVQIMDYSATDKHKTFLIRSNPVSNSAVSAIAARWAQTTAITLLEITDIAGATFDSGSTFSLYGIEA